MCVVVICIAGLFAKESLDVRGHGGSPGDNSQSALGNTIYLECLRPTGHGFGEPFHQSSPVSQAAFLSLLHLTQAAETCHRRSC